MTAYDKYGKSAIDAVKLLMHGKIESPTDAWAEATEKHFPNSKTGRKKGCPRAAFLGLCNGGDIKGVPKGNYTTSKKNKNYAIEAIRLLKSKPELANKKPELWIKACKDKKKKHNSQMDVVLALWEKYL